MGTVTIPRAVRSEYAQTAWLCAFWDGSLAAHSANVYVRWQCEDPWGQQWVETHLLLCKCRVSPLAGSSVPRMELQGLLQATRMLRKVTSCLEFPVERVIIAGDSMCAILATKKDGIHFKT